MKYHAIKNNMRMISLGLQTNRFAGFPVSLWRARSPVTSHHQSPVTSHQSPVTSHQSPVTSHQSPVTSHQSPITNHQSPVTSHQSPGDQLPHKLQEYKPLTHRSGLRHSRLFLFVMLCAGGLSPVQAAPFPVLAWTYATVGLTTAQTPSPTTRRVPVAAGLTDVMATSSDP